MRNLEQNQAGRTKENQFDQLDQLDKEVTTETEHLLCPSEFLGPYLLTHTNHVVDGVDSRVLQNLDNLH